jgi:hypothetical protein
MTSAAKAANQNKALNAALEALRHPKPVQNQVFQQPARASNLARVQGNGNAASRVPVSRLKSQWTIAARPAGAVGEAAAPN